MNDEENNVELTPFIVAALAYSESIREDVDKEFNKDIIVYMNNIENHLYKNSIYTYASNIGDLNYTIYYKKIISILFTMDKKEENIIEFLYPLLKKGYPKIYQVYRKYINRKAKISDVINILNKNIDNKDSVFNLRLIVFYAFFLCEGKMQQFNRCLSDTPPPHYMTYYHSC